MRLLKKGQSQAEIARQLGVSPAAVCVWSRKLKKYGKESLAMQKAPGRPPRLTKADKAELERILKAGAVAAGFESERWTQKRVRQVIEQKFGVRYHRNYISRLLHDMGWSVQKPETRALERDKKKRSGSAQRSCSKMNLASPLRKRSVQPGHLVEKHRT